MRLVSSGSGKRKLFIRPKHVLVDNHLHHRSNVNAKESMGDVYFLHFIPQNGALWFKDTTIILAT